MGRIERVDSELQKELSRILNYEIKDPRITGMVTVQRVETAGDLGVAKVYVSAFGGESKDELLKGLKSSSGYIRNLLFGRLKIRTIPELIFIYDEGLDHSLKIERLLREIGEKK